MLKLVVVIHGPKVTGVGNFPRELGADPPMTMEGKAKMLKLAPALKALGPYSAVYCSLMDRACGTMSTIVKAIGVKRVVCIEELGQMGNLDVDGTIINYPGHEGDNVLTWQNQGNEALHIIARECMDANSTVLIFTHRPILAGMLATAKGLTKPEYIQKILDNPDIALNNFRMFTFDGQLKIAG